MVSVILVLVILITSLPLGYLLAWLTKEELVSGRKYFLWLIITSFIALVVVLMINIESKSAILLALIYIAITSGVSLLKSYDKKFVR